MPITSELKETIDSIVEIHCFKDDSGMHYTEIYADYRDQLDDKTLLRICKSDYPRETFDDLITKFYDCPDYDYHYELLEKIKENADIADALEGNICSEDTISDYLYDIHYVKLPDEHYLNQEFCVNILVNAGDLNYDYTLNTPIANWYGQHDKTVDEDSAILWLARQQGYKKSALTKALRDREYGGSKFLQSVLTEVENCSSSMNALTFLVKMTLSEWFNLHEAVAKEEKLNNRYFPKRSKGRGYLVIDRETSCGLYDPWNGAGGPLEIALDRDVRLPFRMIDSILPDGGRGYSIDEIYGMMPSVWSDNAIKEIHPMKKAA
jgi:hypothetical protein